jgi:hypothetical protein
MNNGRNCDNCEHHLSDEDFAGYGSWSYTCPECGFRYSHYSELTAGEQVAEFSAPNHNQPRADALKG